MGKETIRKYVLQNSIRFNGKPQAGAVIGKVIGENPELKKDIGKLKEEIQKAISETSKLTVEEQLKELEKTAPELLEKKEQEKKKLPELKNAKKGKVIMRFEPSPSGPLHIGHAYMLGLNHTYCEKYGGKFILRISDTNPDNIYFSSYEMIVEDAKWMTNNKIEEVQFQSDHMDKYYYYAEKLIKTGHAYVCTCSSEHFKTLLDKKEACPCRNLPYEDQAERWEKMFSKYKEGDAVVRVKTDMKHRNPAIRDWPAVRIKDSNHPRTGTKYRVWPLMNLAVSVDDIEAGMTHIIRGKDHMDNAKKQEFIYKYLNKKVPETKFVGRINFKGFEVSCTKTKFRIDAGEFSGWDDIRLPFLKALRKRGYQPDTFVNFAIDIGPSQTDKTVSSDDFFKLINACNRDIIDKESNRYFFVKEPVKITIKDSPVKKAGLLKHPDFPKRGRRVFKTNEKFLIAKDDFDSIKEGQLYRLMDCVNFVRRGKEFVFDSEDYETFRKKGKKIMHWLPQQGNADASVRMPDNSVVKGKAEETVKEIEEGSTCQFERFGFARLDNKKKMEFWFGHK